MFSYVSLEGSTGTVPLPPKLLPHLSRAVRLLVLVPHSLNGTAQLVVASLARRPLRRVPLLGAAGNMWTERSVGPRISARPRSIPVLIDRGDHHFVGRVVELRLGEKRRCLPQEFIRALQLEVFSFQLFQLRVFLGAQPRTLDSIASACRTPAAQRFRPDHEFLANRPNRRPLRRMRGGGVEDHPDSAFTQFRRNACWVVPSVPSSL